MVVPFHLGEVCQLVAAVRHPFRRFRLVPDERRRERPFAGLDDEVGRHGVQLDEPGRQVERKQPGTEARRIPRTVGDAAGRRSGVVDQP